MKYLLDTHVLLWAIGDLSKLSRLHKEILKEKNNSISVSQFSYLEIAIKLKLNKLSLFETSISELIEKATEAGFTNLAIKSTHLEQYARLPLLEEHRFVKTDMTEELNENGGYR